MEYVDRKCWLEDFGGVYLYSNVAKFSVNDWDGARIVAASLRRWECKNREKSLSSFNTRTLNSLEDSVRISIQVKKLSAPTTIASTPVDIVG